MTVRNLDALLGPRSAAWVGVPANPVQQGLLDKLAAGSARLQLHRWPNGVPENCSAERPLLAILGDPRFADAATMRRLVDLDCRAVLWMQPDAPTPAVLEAARRNRVRLLGPRSIGFARGGGPDVSMLAQSPLPGSLALIVQSRSVAAAAADWAAGRRIGFSWIATTGGEGDVDVADLLDYAANDRNTRSVAVEIGRIRSGRKFMSAARACARVKPTVILQTRLADHAAAGADPVRSAAFARAGMVEVADLPGLFDSIAALERLPVMQQARVLVVANGAAICALTADAVLREGLTLAEIDRTRRAALVGQLPSLRFGSGTIDIGETDEVQTVAAIRELLDAPSLDALLFVRSPAVGQPHEPVALAIKQAALGARLMCVWLGLETAAPARRISSEAGQATFTSPQAACRAIRYRRDYARNRELLTRTPSASGLVPADAASVAAMLRRHAAGATDAGSDAALDLLTAYGLQLVPRWSSESPELRVRLDCHAEVGMYLRVQRMAPGTQIAYGILPLDDLLADRLLDAAEGEAAKIHQDRNEVRRALLQLSRLAMDQPRVASLDVRFARRGDQMMVVRDARIRLTPTSLQDRDRFALAPFPAALSAHLALSDQRRVAVRAIRPEDEPALISLLESLDPQTVRLRFFACLRHFSHAMAARMTQIDYDRELALVVYEEGGTGRMRALGTLIADPDGRAAEFALLVHQDCARQGLGRYLLQRLIDLARAREIGTIWGLVLQENEAMLGLAARLGFSDSPDPDEAYCRRVELRLGGQ
ncbi:acetyl-CoA synthetase (ADP-forming) [Panacagrimonas perspica]|uniref:Acetyl-CoA synthetase (ADP-forming) n=1 Tax=Panacagrimonas perspica TaxID=381431 RepID=A0A4R7PDH4_9GAMM|nr:GNAT family N-acetyltransferase [Panacagrimonas perspica]TDU31669.1 acetyl-CoA synthetase (ADP-forming) [Panacagrimonas perspica]THD03114.1 hypothetical protein B1810_11010 [Panacagrimonas perspica]